MIDIRRNNKKSDGNNNNGTIGNNSYLSSNKSKRNDQVNEKELVGEDGRPRIISRQESRGKTFQMKSTP
jgi:hypothetical protein